MSFIAVPQAQVEATEKLLSSEKAATATLKQQSGDLTAQLAGGWGVRGCVLAECLVGGCGSACTILKLPSSHRELEIEGIPIHMGVLCVEQRRIPWLVELQDNCWHG